MLIYCLKCKSKKVHESVEGNRVYYFCDDCQTKSGRAFIVDNKIRIINTSRGIKHIAIAALIIKEDKILLIKRRTHPFGLELPAGHVEYDETLDQAVDRELYEELGLKCESKTFLAQLEHPKSYCRYGSDIEEWAIFSVDCQSPEGFVSNHELESFGWFSLKDLPLKELTPPTLFTLSTLGYLPATMKQEKTQ